MAASKEVYEENGNGKFKFAEIVKFLKPRPITSSSLMSWYAPAVGSVSYTLFSIHIFNPRIIRSLFPSSRYIVANSLLITSHVGCVLYLVNSKHLLSSTTVQSRYMYGIYGSLLFNFGSVLIWAVTKAILPEDNIIRSILGLSSTLCLVLIGREYIHHVDRLCEKKD
ncbi:hypothetical protein CHUAL_002672 [Chamberlinius hualienensis]